MDRAQIFSELLARQRLRRDSGLPPLDIPDEYRKAVARGACDDYDTFCDQHADLRARIRASVLAEMTKDGRDPTRSVADRYRLALRAQELFEQEILCRFGRARPPGSTVNLTTYGGARKDGD